LPQPRPPSCRTHHHVLSNFNTSPKEIFERSCKDNPNANLSEKADFLRLAVNEAAFTAVGPAPKSNSPAWFTPPYDNAIIEAAAARNSLFAKLRSIAPTSPLLASTKKALQVARTKVRKLTRKAKATFILIQAKALNDSSDPKSANHSKF
jgi:hypothetical protein